MSFVHPLLLGGLLLVGIPVLIHLIMQQKPKHLLFPAFRFLMQKQRTNQRRLRLRHLLLLALRIVLIAAICLALARPKLFSSRIGIGGNRPVAAVMVFDTSLSMGYQVAKQSRLDEAKRRALELLDSLPDGSRIAVLDTAEPGGEWLNTRAQTEDRISGLKLQPVNTPVTRQLAQAYLLFKALDQEQSDPGEALPRVLCIFSDRTTGCWDVAEAKGLHPPEGLNTVFVDVGVDNPVDLAIVDVKVPRPVVHPGEQARIKFTVMSTGDPGENEAICINDHPEKKTAPDKKPVRLAPDSREEKDFEQTAARPGEPTDASGRMSKGYQQFTIRLSAGDSLPFNDFGYATLKVEEGRKVLIITDRPGDRPEEGDAGRWLEAMNAWHFFPCTTVSTEDAAARFGIKQLSEFEAVVLIDVADPSRLWDRLRIYVEQKGKGLAVVLGGTDWQPNTDAFNKDPGRDIMGAKLEQREDVGDNPGYTWREMEPDTSKAVLHPLIRYFRDKLDVGLGVHFTQESLPRARMFWKVNPDKGKAQPIARYTDKENSPAILERRLDKGRVLIFTSAMDGHVVDNRMANNYLPYWFGMGLMIKATEYLSGDAETPNFNFICGQAVTVPLPQTQATSFTLFGGPDTNGIFITRGKGENELRITQAVQPGNYRVFDPTLDLRQPPIAAFSLNAPESESLLKRVPIEQIESLLGPGSVLSVERGLTLSDKIKGHWLQPLELFPWLMILVLLVLAVENLLSNKFYKRGNREEPASSIASAAGQRSVKELAEVQG